MRRPFGADASCGITSTTTSPGFTNEWVISSRSSSWIYCRAMQSSNASRPSPVTAEKGMRSLPKALCQAITCSALPSLSLFPAAIITGNCCSRIRSSHSFSGDASPSYSPSKRIATSARASTLRAASTRIVPSSPTSSNPAVSAITAAPTPGSSIFFHTVSVVVPATSETIETPCPAIQFTSEDLPAFLRPKIAI